MYPIKYRTRMGPPGDLTFAEAVTAARGNRDRGYLRGEYVTVTAVYAERVEVHRDDGSVVVHEPGEAVFGLDVDVTPRSGQFDSPAAPALVSWGSRGAQDSETAVFYAQLLQHAALIAEAANTGADDNEDEEEPQS